MKASFKRNLLSLGLLVGVTFLGAGSAFSQSDTESSSPTALETESATTSTSHTTKNEITKSVGQKISNKEARAAKIECLKENKTLKGKSLRECIKAKGQKS